MFEKPAELRKLFEQRAAEIAASSDLEQLRIEFLGKKGHVSGLMQELRNVPNDRKKEAGQRINETKQFIENALAQKFEELKKLEEQRLIESAESYDESMPVYTELGSYHPITLVQRELEDIFLNMGFSIEDYSEVTDDYNCFEGVNIPKHHPARDMQDTYYLSNGQLLKTHTSAAQNTILRKYAASLEQGNPLRAVFPGRCFRNEKIDACHENTFFQMEGMMVDKDVSISNLIYFMKTMLSEVFQKDVTVRLRPGFFPFVEPGFELDIQCLICGGEGCPSCKNSGWLELCPCGSSGSKEPDNKTSVDYTVVENADLPEELRKLIESKKDKVMRLTYTTKDYTYVVAGYGTRETSGYSIKVNDVYTGDNALYIDLNLIGPAAGEAVNEVETYPVIVLKMERREESVVFKM